MAKSYRTPDSAASSKGGKNIGDGYMATSEDKTWKSGTGNVRESNINKTSHFGTAMKAKPSSKRSPY